MGISNYSLDAAKVNRALILSVPDLDQKVDELMQTSKNIVESISIKLKNDKIFEILSRTYFDYKNLLQIFKELIVYKKFVSAQKKPEIHKLNSEEINSQENKNLNKDETNTEISQSSNPEGNDEEVNKPKEREKRQFEYIKGLKEFKNLFKQEKKIRKDFMEIVIFII